MYLINFMDWSHGLEPWIAVLYWSKMLERKRNSYSGGEIGLV